MVREQKRRAPYQNQQNESKSVAETRSVDRIFLQIHLWTSKSQSHHEKSGNQSNLEVSLRIIHRLKKLQSKSKTPQTPTLVRGKVFKPILKQSKRKPKLGSRRRPTSSIPSIPQPPSPDIPKNQGRKRRGRDKTPEPREVSRTPVLRRCTRVKKSWIAVLWR